MAWTSHDSAALYALDGWGQGYFRVGDEGELHVAPGRGDPSVSLAELVRDLRRRGIHPPLLLRFNDILADRVNRLFGSFRQSITEYDYQGAYRGVYPIKVNQQRHVVEALLQAGRPHGLGLEVGSKPELLAGLAILDDPNALLICNGYKDREFIELALESRRLGRDTILVVERLDELEMTLQLANELRIEPAIGLRAKLSTRGAGKWESSSGDRSKFGLGPSALVHAVNRLRERDALQHLSLLHFHIGSQITTISNIKRALREAARVYVELVKLGAPLTLFDIGGGLGVDYDGSHTRLDLSVDYTDQEYANDVVWVTQEVCNEAGVPHPDLISESGRALVAHHSVLVVDITGTSRTMSQTPPPLPEDAPNCLRNLQEAADSLNDDNVLEVCHDLELLRDELLTLFNHSILSLEQRAHGERLLIATYARIAEQVSVRVDGPNDVPAEVQSLERSLAQIYYGNFSIFQSLPDTWAISHRFPVMPIVELDQQPTQPAILADLTCDSDGKVDSFSLGREVRDTLPLHPRTDDDGPYPIAFFLVGAYQEILGDLHNLFGDTNAIHVDLDEAGGVHFGHLVEADRISEVLASVEYSRSRLTEAFRRAAERAVRDHRLSPEESAKLLRRYGEILEGSTYPTE